MKKEYLDHLRKHDDKVPKHVEDGNEKLYVGVVMSTNKTNYFVPLSSFDQYQQTNFVLEQQNKRKLGSLRLSFMLPVDEEHSSVLEKIDLNDYNDKDIKYRRLLDKQLRLCTQNKDQIINRAKKVYDMGNDPEHPRYKDCVKFKNLEEKSLQYDAFKEKRRFKKKSKDIEL